MINVTKRHPIDLTRPLIYYDVILVLLPAELGGSNIGVIVSLIFPESVLYILAMIVLFIAAFSTFDKGREQYDKETKVLNQSKDISATPLLGDATNNNDNRLLDRNFSDGDALDSGVLPPIQYPWFIISIIAFVFICYVGLYLGIIIIITLFLSLLSL